MGNFRGLENQNEVSIEATKNEDGIFIGNMSIGLGRSQFNFIFDLSNPFTIAPSTNCPETTCNGTRFNTAKSTSYNQVSSNQYSFNVTENNTYLQASGYFGQDQLNFNQTSIAGYNFLLVSSCNTDTNSQYLQHGVWIGLGLISDRFAYLKQLGHNLPSKLYDNGLVSQQLFAIQQTSSTLKVTFGGYDESYIAKSQGSSSFQKTYIKWMNISDSYKNWTIQYNSISIGQTVQLTKVASQAVLDINYPYIKVPQSHLKAIITQIQKYKTCTKANWQLFYYCSCKNFFDCQFPQINIQVNSSFNLTLNNSVYVKYDYATLKCVILIEGDNSTNYTWTLGQIFFKNFYTIFDIENLRMGFVSYTSEFMGISSSVIANCSSTSTSSSTSSSQTDSDSTTSISWYTLAGIIVAGIILILIIVCIFWYRCTQKKKKLVVMIPQYTKIPRTYAFYDQITYQFEFKEISSDFDTLGMEHTQEGYFEEMKELEQIPMFVPIQETMNDNKKIVSHRSTSRKQQQSERNGYYSLRNPFSNRKYESQLTNINDMEGELLKEDDEIIFKDRKNDTSIDSFQSESDVHLEETISQILNEKVVEKVEEKATQLEKYVYVPKKKDPIDVEIAKIINNNDDISIPIVKLDRGYLIGTELQLPFIKGNNAVIRVGGGYDELSKYIKRSQEDSHDKIQKIMNQQFKSYQEVLSDLLMREYRDKERVEKQLNKMQWWIVKQALTYKDPLTNWS